MALIGPREWQIEDYLRVLFLHRWWVLLLTGTFGGFTALYMAQQPNIYTATTRIVVEFQAARVTQFEEVTPYATDYGDLGFIQTEYRIITSAPVMERVVRTLNLTQFPPFSRSEDPVELLQSLLDVKIVRGTRLVDITASGGKPELTARIADAVAEAYAALNLERRQQQTAGGARWLQDEVIKMEEGMRHAQLALQDFLEKNGTVDFGEAQQNLVLQRLRELSTAITQTREQRIEAETKYRQKHPAIQELVGKEKELAQAMNDQEQKTLEMSRLAIQYNALQREAKTTEGIYNSLLTRSKELSIQEGLKANNVKVVNTAKIPQEPSAPDRGRSIGVACLIGFLLGSGLAFFLELTSKTLRTRQEFEQILEIPFLGYVPLIRPGGVTRGRESLVLLNDSNSTAAEAVRSLRTTLEFLLPSGQQHVLMVTSALPQEGKSLVCANLAMALSEMGRKVLLVDGDMRRPSQHRIFQLRLEPGLGEYLQGSEKLETVVQKIPMVEGLYLIPAGGNSAQPIDLLISTKFQAAMEAWRQEYQYVLVDTPPVLAVADATTLTTLVDGTIFLLRAGRTHREVGLAAKQRLVDVGAKLIGGVLNGARLEMERGYRYYYYYRGGHKYKRKKERPIKPAPPQPSGPDQNPHVPPAILRPQLPP